VVGWLGSTQKARYERAGVSGVMIWGLG